MEDKNSNSISNSEFSFSSSLHHASEKAAVKGKENVTDMTTIMSRFKLLTSCIIINYYILTNTSSIWSCYVYLSRLLFHVLGVSDVPESFRSWNIPEAFA